MLSLRSLTRSAPRALARPPTRLSTRIFAGLRKPSQLQQPWRIATIPTWSAFSTFPARFEKEGTSDEELSTSFESELQLEKESSESDELPPHLKEFLDTTPFEVTDTPGGEEVTLTRTFGNEHIRVVFSIADINAIDHDPDQYSQDKAMEDEEGNFDPEVPPPEAQPKRTINSSKGQSSEFNIAPEDAVAPADNEELMEDGNGSDEPSFPARLNVTITKDGVDGAMQFEAVAHDGSIVIDSFYQFPKKEFAEAKTAEEDWARRNMYTGPPFANLDEDLQGLLEKFLEERGINTALALWVPEYVDYKEQKEYMKWLADAKAFVDA